MTRKHTMLVFAGSIDQLSSRSKFETFMKQVNDLAENIVAYDEPGFDAFKEKVEALGGTVIVADTREQALLIAKRITDETPKPGRLN